MKKLLKIIGLLILLPLLYVAGVVVYGSVHDWEPEPYESVALSHSEALSPPITQQSFKTMIWNIGYGGLGKESDFFYDGGKTVHQTPELVAKNEAGVLSFLKKHDADFYLFQEVDRDSKRSHGHDQVDMLGDLFSGYDQAFASNYKVKFVPLPLTNPLGRVHSGLATFSRFALDSAARVAYETQFEWPRRLFFLDRCFMPTWVDLEGERDLLIINTHNTAYDLTGELSKGELQTLLDYADRYAKQGHYVVIGGDWNRCPPGYNPKDPDGPYREHLLSNSDIPEGWTWVADTSTPTNRKLPFPYDPKKSYTSCIDHFLCAPGIKIEEVKTINTNFEWSDHQPIMLTFRIGD